MTIGGDDFIIITRPTIGVTVAETVIHEFENLLSHFHDEADYAADSYAGFNRSGNKDQLPLLSLSIAIISTEIFKINSYPQLASISCEVKKAAKMQPGLSIARDQRMMKESVFEWLLRLWRASKDYVNRTVCNCLSRFLVELLVSEIVPQYLLYIY